MKAGVVYPQTELGGDPGAVKAFAQAAEELGYDHVVIYDHVLNVAVAVGDAVAAGDPLGEAGNWSPTARRVELQINDPSGVSRCPLDFATVDFAARHEALRVSANAEGFGPFATYCLTDSVNP